jgi:uncharacterized phage protein (TIGR02216 family)
MRLSPETFWSMSLPEWHATVAGFAARTGARRTVPLTRSEFEQLMQKYPDR